MSRAVRIPAPVRERRSHSERTAETRARVMAAVVESIDAVGLQRTTAAEISRRAGVSWGAVQHHFHDKEGILIAVLEQSFALFAERLGEPPTEARSLEARIALFVERAWSHFSSPEYRSTYEILRSLPPDLDRSWQDELMREWLRIWSTYFPESASARVRTTELLYYTFSVLSGIAGARVVVRAEGRLERSGLERLKDDLRRGFVEAG